MNYLDIFVLILIAYFVFLGASRGFIAEALAMVGVIVAVMVSFMFAEDTHSFIEIKLSLKPHITVVYVILFVSTFLIIRLLAKAMTRFSKALRLSLINRLFGSAFGLVKSAALLVLCYHLYVLSSNYTDIEHQPVITSSEVLPLIQKLYDSVMDTIL